MKRTLIGIFFLVIAAGIVLGVVYYNSVSRHVPVVFSPHEMIRSLWSAYTQNTLEPSTDRTLDKSRGNSTTSEGEAYTMLRAVWVDDKATFDRSLAWTNDILRHPDDHLFSWFFGRRVDGTYGVLLDQGGNHTASDADTDIALALIFAYERWHESAYLDEAKLIIPSIWENEVVTVGGRPYLAANNIEKESPDRIIVNPSYFEPYAYREFAKVDKTHRWSSLVDSSYELLSRSTTLPLGSSRSGGLPPDWVEMDRHSGALRSPTSINLTTTFGYDALRIPWRLGLDYLWTNDLRAKMLLEKFSVLSSEWKSSGTLAAVHAHDGKRSAAAESPALYGAALPYFEIVDAQAAEEVYRNKLQILYNPDTRTWKTPLSYYDDNWVWFGMAYHWKELPDFGTVSLAGSTSTSVQSH